MIFGELSEQLVPTQQAWLGRFQQYCSAVAAKGVEDTAFYRYIPMLALNEVGGAPEVGEQPIQSFHSRARFRAKFHPRNLVATATHDHKRGEDTRMRLIAISQEPQRWDETVRALQSWRIALWSYWSHSTRSILFLSDFGGYLEPQSDDKLRARMHAYMQKAMRESKYQTSWNNPDETYEKALDAFIDGMLDDERLEEVIGPFAKRIADLGYRNSLSQLVLKFTSPGVPDIYQGCELLDLSLVDPDNRRAVDYESRNAWLDQFANSEMNSAAMFKMIEANDERLKLYLTQRFLHLRREHESLFEHGSYRDLELSNDCERWIAFARELSGEVLVVIVSRLHSDDEMQCWPKVLLGEDLQGRRWKDGITGDEFACDAAIDLQCIEANFAVLYSGAESDE